MSLTDASRELAESTPAPSAPAAEPTPAAPGEEAAPRGCPFLLAEPGGWRLDRPSADHRCAAFSPSAPLAPEKQARLCLTPSHSGCATYLASLAARETRLGPPPGDRATRWGLARTVTVIEDPGGIRARLLASLLDRRRWPAIPAVILVSTLFALALSGFRAIPAEPAATSSPIPGTRAPTTAPTAAPTPAATAPAPSATPAPTTAPTPTAAPSAAPTRAFRTYRVQPGDTLSAIASRFGVSIQSIVNLNNISNPNQLTVGQVLKIP